MTATYKDTVQTLAVDLPPGRDQPTTGFPGSQCVRILLIAVDKAGAEVAREDREVCYDQTWVVGAAAPS